MSTGSQKQSKLYSDEPEFAVNTQISGLYTAPFGKNVEAHEWLYKDKQSMVQ